ncbi:MAG: hypothetical protein NTY83_03170 [Candidatus Micrarchaeota archaeon]|nr:hypothetical protein [Candidatus Micrarchaeota archaeon]
MKHRHTHKPTEQKPTEKERFEKWLMEDRIGIKNCRNGSRLQEAIIYCNLERASTAPFDTDAKVSVLSSLFMPSQLNKALLVLEALSDIAMEGSKYGREAFENAASRWLGDQTLRHLSIRTWCKGTILILRAAAQLDSPELNMAIAQVIENEPNAGLQIVFWKHALPFDCDVL